MACLGSLIRSSLRSPMSMSSSSSSSKLPLPAFLKVLNNGGIPMPKAMALASKMYAQITLRGPHRQPCHFFLIHTDICTCTLRYKTHNSPSKLSQLTDSQLKSLGVEAKEDRRHLLAALKQAGFKTTPQKALQVTADSASTGLDTNKNAGSSSVFVIHHEKQNI